jgi:glycosyltransferase involved in cell wall biosynthesis
VDVSKAGNATESQSLFNSFKHLAQLLKHRPKPNDVLFVELAGRFLCQFYTAIFTVVFFRRVRVVCYLHDVPSVVGNARLFREFDRRYFRWVSRLIFPRINLESLLLSRSVVITTNEQARRFLEQTYDVRCTVLPLVYADLSLVNKADICFVPGPVNVDELAVLLPAIQCALPTFTVNVGFIVGDAEKIKLLQSALSTVKFRGFLDDQELHQEYLMAKVVIRYRKGEPVGNTMASSGPVVFGASAGCFVVTNDARGSSDYFRSGAGAIFADPAEDLVDLLAANVLSERRLADSLDRNREYYSANHTVRSASVRLRTILNGI